MLELPLELIQLCAGMAGTNKLARVCKQWHTYFHPRIAVYIRSATIGRTDPTYGGGVTEARADIIVRPIAVSIVMSGIRLIQRPVAPGRCRICLAYPLSRLRRAATGGCLEIELSGPFGTCNWCVCAADREQSGIYDKDVRNATATWTDAQMLTFCSLFMIQLVPDHTRLFAGIATTVSTRLSTSPLRTTEQFTTPFDRALQRRVTPPAPTYSWRAPVDVVALVQAAPGADRWFAARTS